MTRVLLTTLNAKYIHINLAIRLLYSLNKERHAGLHWREFTIKEKAEDIAAQCVDNDVVAFSCYIWNITQTLAVARAIKALNPKVKILLGGPEVSYEWQEILLLDEIDYIITGEGEVPFKAFLDNFPNVDAVPSLVRKVGNGEMMQNLAAPMFDLTEYADLQPYLHEPPEALKNKVLYIETSRGCPYKCTFCLASLDNKVRYLPNDSIKTMLLYLMQNGKVIKFLDRTFNIKRDFTLDIFAFILEHHRPDNVFQFEITADILHADIIRFIQEKVPKGLFRFEIGIQTVNQQANLAVSRKQSFEKTKSIIQQLDHKVEMHLDLIVGLALDYWDDIKYSFEQVFALFAPELQLGFLKFLKGTPLRDTANEHGFVYDPNPPYQIIESKYLSRAQLHLIELCEHGLEVYWNKPRAVRTLKYVTTHYSVFDFLTQLGVFFAERQDLHQYTLKEVYQILYAFVQTHFPDDAILQQLITLDYYSYYKVKPETLFVPELPRSEKQALLQSLGYARQKARFVALPLTFDYAVFEAENKILAQESTVLLRYDGQHQATTEALSSQIIFG